jgi:hypothetical protein
MTMTARMCNELLAELDRVADRRRENELAAQALEQQASAERLVSLYEAALRSHEMGSADAADNADDATKGAVG